MRRLLSALLLALALAAPAAARGQGAEPGASEAAVAAEASPAATPGGLPPAAAPPRTLRAHWHVFVAFAVVWVLLFGYALSLGRRFAALEREVQRLSGGGTA